VSSVVFQKKLSSIAIAKGGVWVGIWMMDDDDGGDGIYGIIYNMGQQSRSQSVHSQVSRRNRHTQCVCHRHTQTQTECFQNVKYLLLNVMKMVRRQADVDDGHSEV